MGKLSAIEEEEILKPLRPTYERQLTDAEKHLPHTLTVIGGTVHVHIPDKTIEESHQLLESMQQLKLKIVVVILIIFTVLVAWSLITSS